ncbi:MAG: glycosyltransferase family 2 protein [Ardenticatenia bacterium]|nr:MAG: glycosyltransferase family 2 protein [Ardenticatenia bacterium]
MLDLLVVVVNYNTCDYLYDCLASLYANEGDFSLVVCVVDNASCDGSCEMVRERFPQVHLISSCVNGGFAYGNNLALRAYGFRDTDTSEGASEDDTELPRYVMLLNPDTVVPPDGLQSLLSFMDAHPHVGICGPKLVLEDGSLDLACRRSFPTPAVSFYRMVGLSRLFPHHPVFGRYNLTYCDPDQEMEVDAVVGACMVVRREAIQQVGLLDESYFMYGEDLDWAYRMHQAGWKTYYYPAVTVRHVKRAASRHSPRAQMEFYRAMRIFYIKHYASSTPRLLHWLVLLGIGLRSGFAKIQLALSPPRLTGQSG